MLQSKLTCQLYDTAVPREHALEPLCRTRSGRGTVQRPRCGAARAVLRARTGPGAAEAWHRLGRARTGTGSADPQAPSRDRGHSARWRAGTAERQLSTDVQEPRPGTRSSERGAGARFSVTQSARQSHGQHGGLGAQPRVRTWHPGGAAAWARSGREHRHRGGRGRCSRHGPAPCGAGQPPCSALSCPARPAGPTRGRSPAERSPALRRRPRPGSSSSGPARSLPRRHHHVVDNEVARGQRARALPAPRLDRKSVV